MQIFFTPFMFLITPYAYFVFCFSRKGCLTTFALSMSFTGSFLVAFSLFILVFAFVTVGFLVFTLLLIFLVCSLNAGSRTGDIMVGSRLVSPLKISEILEHSSTSSLSPDGSMPSSLNKAPGVEKNFEDGES